MQRRGEPKADIDRILDGGGEVNIGTRIGLPYRDGDVLRGRGIGDVALPPLSTLERAESASPELAIDPLLRARQQLVADPDLAAHEQARDPAMPVIFQEMGP